MLATHRLLLRAFELKDATDLHEYLSRPEIYTYEPGDPINLEQAQRLTAKRAASRDFWAMELKAEHNVVGHIYLKQTEPPELQTWEMGYIVNPVHQRMGYATEACKTLAAHVFRALGAHRIMAHCNPQNVASWKVLEKVGFKREGLLRQNIYFRTDARGDPIWTDSFEYGMLAADIGE